MLRIIENKEHKKLSDLAEIEIDIKSSLSEWHNVEKEFLMTH